MAEEGLENMEEGEINETIEEIEQLENENLVEILIAVEKRLNQQYVL